MNIWIFEFVIQKSSLGWRQDFEIIVCRRCLKIQEQMRLFWERIEEGLRLSFVESLYKKLGKGGEVRIAG